MPVEIDENFGFRFNSASCAVDSDGNIFVAGETTGSFVNPDANPPPHATYGYATASTHPFVIKISSEDSSLIDSGHEFGEEPRDDSSSKTYLSAVAVEEGFVVAVKSRCPPRTHAIYKMGRHGDRCTDSCVRRR